MASGEQIIRLTLPKVSIGNLIDYFYTRKASSESLRRKCERAIKIVLEDADPGKPIEEIEKIIVEKLLNKYRVREALEFLRQNSLPLNPYTLSIALNKVGVKASKTTCATVISWLRIGKRRGKKVSTSLMVFGTFNVPVIPSDETEKVYVKVLSRGEIKYKELAGDAEILNIDNALLRLISEGKVGIRYGKEKLEGVIIENPMLVDKIPRISKMFKKEWLDLDGKAHEKLEIPGDAYVYAIL